ncbi:MAG: TM2 domain-containing protein [Anaerovibrio sp.]|nr:TM2 domain-containing protein [Anaerovibrio sp.]
MVSGETVLVSPGKVVNKTVYILLALFLGGFGAHKFYTGRIGLGILYLVFFWTWIPGIIAAIEAIYVGIKKNSDAYGNITM